MTVFYVDIYIFNCMVQTLSYIILIKISIGIKTWSSLQLRYSTVFKAASSVVCFRAEIISDSNPHQDRFVAKVFR